MPTYSDFTVEYWNAPNDWVVLDFVQSLSCSVGRRASTDEWQVSTCTFTINNPAVFSSPIAPLVPGRWVRWFAPGRDTTKPSWVGSIRDVRLDVEIVWDSVNSLGNADVLTVDCEGHLATWGRSLGAPSSFFTMPTDFPDVMDEWYDTDSSDLRYGPVDTSLPFFRLNWSGQSSGADWLRTAAATADVRILDGIENDSAWNTGTDEEPSLYLVAQSDVDVAGVTFSDTTNDATHRAFSQISFDSLADSTFTQVIVAPDQVAEQSARFGSAPYRDLSVSTYSATTDEALTLAEYFLNLYKTPSLGVAELVAYTQGQHTKNLDTLGVTNLEFGYLPRYQIEIELRGQVFLAQIEGATVSAAPGQPTAWTYYLTPVPVLGWFTLDSADFGELDDDRLAYL